MAKLLFEIVGIKFMTRQQFIEFGAVAPGHARSMGDVAFGDLQNFA
jgi:hypothetical protein